MIQSKEHSISRITEILVYLYTVKFTFLSILLFQLTFLLFQATKCLLMSLALGLVKPVHTGRCSFHMNTIPFKDKNFGVWHPIIWPKNISRTNGRW